ncbi:SDR family NAD(P)-dependent oxidoreductase [Paludisphaera mucosa]|uniref:SDR family oxidoreductase n=1 Tax=Paludisphaera mucosa TaxID=3030827 RepID=A0ABT6F759_9BACT|nr:SDR family NAD(P)-dependent oxidoreductase [Paludisphaera mucosa]MDG3003426.1 SDR family oxidoreductase [Paludisphaera mucosa]
MTAVDNPGKVVLITGGRRVGSVLAKQLAASGWRVAMTYRESREAIERAVAAVEAAGSEGLAVAADLTDPAQADEAVEATIRRFGRIDALVNMASVYKKTPLAELKPSDFEAMIAANLAAPYHAAIAAARRMSDQTAVDGIKGKIVFLGDWATERPHKDYLPYLAAKGGMTTLAMALAVELAPYIPVATIQPAMIEPPPDFNDDDKQAVIDATPLRRLGSPDDVNRLIAYLLDGTNFVTGVCYRVDGGRFLGEG